MELRIKVLSKEGGCQCYFKYIPHQKYIKLNVFSTNKENKEKNQYILIISGPVLTALAASNFWYSQHKKIFQVSAPEFGQHICFDGLERVARIDTSS